MNFATLNKTPPSYFPLPKLSKPNYQNRKRFNLSPKFNESSYLSCKRAELSAPCLAATEAGAAASTSGLAGKRLRSLVLEFESLKEPIDRVKRLLDYAARLPPFNESARSPANRVTGCTTQVWLEARMDEFGRMRFCADSDSEISKGFVSCLIWLLDGAEPAEVAAVKADDLAAVNVGLYVKAKSRVNTWHNVLIVMQKRTQDLVAEKTMMPPAPLVMEPLPSLALTKKQQSRWEKLDANFTRS